MKRLIAALTLVAATMVAAPPAHAAENEIDAYITGYSYWDNTPPGSSAISNPVIHRRAGGTGTFRNPVTIAVGHTISGGRDILDYEEGTKFYIPSLRKYFIVEDTCGDGPRPQDGPCHDLSDAPRGSEAWLDVWVGGRNSSPGSADRCMSELTGLHTVIENPRSGYRVVPGNISSRGGCIAGFGENPIGGGGQPPIPPGCDAGVLENRPNVIARLLRWITG